MWTKIIINFLLIVSAYLSVIIFYIAIMTIREKSRNAGLKDDSDSTGIKRVQKLHKA